MMTSLHKSCVVLVMKGKGEVKSGKNVNVPYLKLTSDGMIENSKRFPEKLKGNNIILTIVDKPDILTLSLILTLPVATYSNLATNNNSSFY